MDGMAEYKREFEVWRSFLNREISYFIFASGIGIMALPQYENLVFVVLFFVVAMTWSSGKFPRLLSSLRKKKRNRLEDYLYRKIIKADFGIKALCGKFLPYTLSCVFLITVLAGLWG